MKNKRLVFSVLGILLLVGGVLVGLYEVRQRQIIEKSAAPATTLSLLAPNNISALTVGDSFNAEVWIDTAGQNSVIGTELYLTFDKDILRADSVSVGSYFDSPQIQTNEIGNGTISYVIFLPPGAIPSSETTGVIATIGFTAVGAGTSTVDFTNSTIVAAASPDVGVNVLQTANPLTVTISGPTATSTPTLIPTGTVSLTPTATLTATPTATLTATATPTNTATPTPTTGTGGNGGTSTPTPTNTTTPTPTSGSSSSSPTLKITSLANGQTITDNTPTIKGTAPLNSTVALTVASDPITGSTTTDASGNWSWTVPTALEDGAHTVTAEVGSSSVSVNFNVDTSAASTLPDAGVSYPTMIGLVAGFVVLFMALIFAL